MPPRLDIVIPVYNEGENIARTLQTLARDVKTPNRVLICYDFPQDNTLPAIEAGRPGFPDLHVELVRNNSRGAHHAIMAGLAASEAPYVVVYPADDDFNAIILDRMATKAADGNDIVCASRFMPGGSMVGCPWLKSLLVHCAAFTLHHFARLPTRDATNGFRLFSRRVIDTIPIESDRGFCFSIELLVKCHRLGWPVGEVPAQWIERIQGQSRFQVLSWLPAYLRWYRYAFATTFLRRPATSVNVRTKAAEAEASSA
jgi:dolichol-phosphate mannosyltransferase